jgi:hypothetical protein
MDPEEVYGDVRDADGATVDKILCVGGKTENATYWFDYDNYYNDSKRTYFMGDGLLAAAVKAKNAEVVDTTETTYTWRENAGEYYLKNADKSVPSEAKEYQDDPFKVYLDIKTGAEDKGSALGANLKGNYYINTAVGYVSVLPKYTVAYMLQYEDPRNDKGQNSDKLVAFTYKSISKEEIRNAKGNNQVKFKLDPTDESKAGLTFDGDGKAVDVNTWAAADGTLNAEDKDKVSAWVNKGTGNQIIDSFGGSSADMPINEDMFIWAKVTAYAGSYIEIESLAPVYYNGLQHVAGNRNAWHLGGNNDDYDDYNEADVKSNQIPDLDLYVRDTKKGANLIIGKDYTVSYKNNINASVYFVDDEKTSIADKVKPNYTKSSKKPQVVITGAGRYKGKFKATINFDIYPANIGGGSVFLAPQGIQNIKPAYFAKTGKSAKVAYNVKESMAPSKVELGEHPDGKAYYDYDANWDKAKTVTLKKNKDYSERFERLDDEAKDKNGDSMGYTPVTSKQLLPNESGDNSAVQYRLTVRGVGNYCGTSNATFEVYNEKSCADISKLKITVPKTLNWESLMLDGNNILDKVPLEKLGIKLESKKKTTRKNGTGAGQVVNFDSNNWTYDIYRVDKNGAHIVVQNGVYSGETFKNAGNYKIVIKPKDGNTIKENVTVYDKDGKIDNKKSKTTTYRGTVEKTFTIKGITLKKGDFKLAWASKKWNGKNDAQSLSFKKAIPQALTKGKLNQVYVDKYLKNYNAETWEPFWNANEKRFEAYVRDYCLKYDQTPANAVKYIIDNKTGYALGDVYYEDNGLKWGNSKQIDTYRYTFETAGNNKDVGTYTITVPTEGVFGKDGLKITYKRTGTATKVLEVKKAK